MPWERAIYNLNFKITDKYEHQSEPEREPRIRGKLEPVRESAKPAEDLFEGPESQHR
jgi:hypothetical protein